MRNGCPCPSLVSCHKDSNITMGRFRITVDRYLKFTDRTQAWYLAVLLPVWFCGARLFYHQRNHTVPKPTSNTGETRHLIFCPSGLPSAIWFLDGPVFFETKTSAVKCQRAQRAGSFHRRTVSRLKLWTERMGPTMKCSKLGGGITCPYVIIATQKGLLFCFS